MVHKMEKVKLLNNHESVTSQESIEMEEYSDEEDEVFVRGKWFFNNNQISRLILSWIKFQK